MNYIGSLNFSFFISSDLFCLLLFVDYSNFDAVICRFRPMESPSRDRRGRGRASPYSATVPATPATPAPTSASTPTPAPALTPTHTSSGTSTVTASRSGLLPSGPSVQPRALLSAAPAHIPVSVAGLSTADCFSEYSHCTEVAPRAACPVPASPSPSPSPSPLPSPHRLVANSYYHTQSPSTVLPPQADASNRNSRK